MRKLIALATATGLIAALMIVTGAIAANDTTYAGCLDDKGNLTDVAEGTEPLEDCDKKSRPITWNAEGPQGPQGVPGIDGQDGADGEPGPQGSSGADGRDGTDGEPCTVVDDGEGTITMICPDGTSASWDGTTTTTSSTTTTVAGGTLDTCDVGVRIIQNGTVVSISLDSTDTLPTTPTPLTLTWSGDATASAVLVSGIWPAFSGELLADDGRSVTFRVPDEPGVDTIWIGLEVQPADSMDSDVISIDQANCDKPYESPVYGCEYSVEATDSTTTIRVTPTNNDGFLLGLYLSDGLNTPLEGDLSIEASGGGLLGAYGVQTVGDFWTRVLHNSKIADEGWVEFSGPGTAELADPDLKVWLGNWMCTRQT